MQTDPQVRTQGQTPHRRRLVVRGAVQGVGFRPFVYREARRLGLAGWVRNSAAGVTIEVEGCADRVDELVDVLRRGGPAPARVDALAQKTLPPQGEAGFDIRDSDTMGIRSAEVLPDIAVCDDCLAELRDPADRRFRYPFINCTRCGPRYSIIEDIPYDRSRTSMRRFTMCAACRAEYDDAASRRFHAEPNACPECGPRLALWDAGGAVVARVGEALARAVAAVREGAIVAVKGIGGFHLFADACNEAAVARLRRRKGRPEKPFAVTFQDRDEVARCCRLGPAAERLLSGPERPIVLLPWEGGSITRLVAPCLALGTARLGALLPYSPLHHLLLEDIGRPVVATSGNLSNEPIVTDEATALHRLAGVADLFLVHDRPIVRPVDDTVAQVVGGEAQLLRRARGYAPAPIAVAGLADGGLAHGAHLKATVAVATPAGLVLGQHLGDLESEAAREAYAAGLADLPRLHGATPRMAVRDLHPDYASSGLAEASGLPVVAVQHHAAHVAACLAEHGLGPPALGIAWDGTGYGPDGTIWGGEFLHVTEAGWRRVARLRPFRLPGGEAAVREPRRAALGLLHELLGEACFERRDLAPVAAFAAGELRVLATMIARGVNAPVTSSAGRLFDGVAALCGLCQVGSYEGQAAAGLEAVATARPDGAAYPFPRRAGEDGTTCLEVDWRPAIAALIGDIEAGAAVGVISARFHAGLVRAIVEVARHAGQSVVALTGGCFQNVRLTEAAIQALERAGYRPLCHRRVPPNDGGIAFGQAVWASWMERTGDGSCA
jgi:hydrogenase maturation protein HypF